MLYRVGRKSKCGDLLPVKEIKDHDVSTQFEPEELNDFVDSGSKTSSNDTNITYWYKYIVHLDMICILFIKYVTQKPIIYPSLCLSLVTG